MRAAIRTERQIKCADFLTSREEASARPFFWSYYAKTMDAYESGGHIILQARDGKPTRAAAAQI